MSDNEWPPDPLGEERSPRPALSDEIRRSMKAVDEFIQRAREHHARTGEWPPDPLLDEVADMRRQIMAEHGNDWRKVLQWHIEQDRLFVEQNPDAKLVERRSASAGVSGR